MSGVLRWEDPAPLEPGRRVGNPRIPWAFIAEQLRQNPGRWAVVYEGAQAPHIQQRINNGTSPWFQPKGAFEVTTRGRQSGLTTVYARFIGETPP